MVIFAVAFDVAVDNSDHPAISDERFGKFKIAVIASLQINGDTPDAYISVEYVPEFTHHRQLFRAWRNDWTGDGTTTIRQLMLLSAIKYPDNPMFMPVTHVMAILRKVSEIANQIIIVPVD